VLVQKGLIEEKDLARLLADQKGLPFVSLRGRGFDKEIARLLPERVCRFHTVMAVEMEDGELLVAIADPGNDEAVSDIRSELDQIFRLVVAMPSEIFAALDQVFGNGHGVVASGATPAGASSAVASADGSSSPEFGLRIALAQPNEPMASDPEPLPVPEPEPEPRGFTAPGGLPHPLPFAEPVAPPPPDEAFLPALEPAPVDVAAPEEPAVPRDSNRARRASNVMRPPT